MTTHRTPLVLAMATALLALSACEVRDPNAVEPTPTPTPTDTASAPAVASIIREDIEESQPMIEVPAEPVDVTIPFADGGTQIGENAERLLASVLDSEAMEEPWPIVLGGHTDSEGNDRANLRASRARAEAVAAWLVERGVDDDRLRIVAFGEQNPIAPNAMPDGEPNEAGRRKNRRVQVTIDPPATPEAGPSDNASPTPSATPSAAASGAAKKQAD